MTARVASKYHVAYRVKMILRCTTGCTAAIAEEISRDVEAHGIGVLLTAQARNVHPKVAQVCRELHDLVVDLASASATERSRVADPHGAAALIAASLPEAAERQEHFVVLCLDAQGRPIGDPAIVFVGSVNEVAVHPREVFRVAIDRSATSVVVAHNHPSKSVEPSGSDNAITQRLAEAGKLLGIQVLDHLILSGRAAFPCYSYAQHGRLS